MRHLANSHSVTGPAGSIYRMTFFGIWGDRSRRLVKQLSCRYYIQDVFFWRLAGPVAPTGKAIVHWIGINFNLLIKFASL